MVFGPGDEIGANTMQLIVALNLTVIAAVVCALPGS